MVLSTPNTPSTPASASPSPALAPATVLDPIALRREHRGLLSIQLKVPVKDAEMLSVVYTPGVAKPCLEIEKNPLLSFDYTMRGNTIAVVSNGSSVYGLGHAGAKAAIPMLEAKSVLHKTLAGIDAVPIAIDTTDAEQLVETIRQLEPTFGGFQLDGMSSPLCYVVEEKLKRSLSVPVMHGEHSTAVVVTAALLNALRLVGKRLQEVSVVINGAGTSGISTARLLLKMGVGQLRICDEYGRISATRPMGMNWIKAELAQKTNPQNQHGTLEEALIGADVYIGYIDNSTLAPSAIQAMAAQSIVFALALPKPEVSYAEAKAAGAAVVATQDSQSPNSINVSMAYPGIFRGALDVKATRISSSMLIAAALALSGLVDEEALSEENIIPTVIYSPVAGTVARAVAQAAIEANLARTIVSPASIERKALEYLQEGSAAWIKPERPGYEQLSTDEKAMELRRRYQGVIETSTHVPILDQETYRTVYSKVNVVKVCQEIQANPEALYDLTCKSNLVGIVTDGSAVLGLGNIGAGAGLPVMEGKSVLFKAFGGVEAFPICLQTQNVEELIASIKALTPIFGGINLEDIAAPRCFEIEERLIAETDIAIFHDDQHGTAVVATAAILNAVKAVGKPLNEVRITVNGAGASALSVSKLLLLAGVKDIVICDTKGTIYKGRTHGMNTFKHKIAELTNLNGLDGQLKDAVAGADIFIGLSVPGALSQDMVRSMAKDPIILAMANPTPEIMPDEAFAAGAKIMGTGRSDFPNQVNNCLAFPGIFRGALDVRASVINDEMKLAAAYAIASTTTPEELSRGIIIPSTFDLSVPPKVAAAVAKKAMETGVARRPVNPEAVAKNLETYLQTGDLGDPAKG